MNAKILTVVVGLLMLVPAGFAYGGSDGLRFGDCPDGYSCEQQPSGEPFPPDAVTGHTVYAKFVIEFEDNARNTLGLPTDFAAVAGFFAVRNVDQIKKAVQRECVVWFNGKNLDQRPDPDPNFNGGGGDANDYPSDEDQPYNGPNAGNGQNGGGGDKAYQDYDFDRDVDSCLPNITYGDGYLGENETGNATFADYVDYANYAVVVEKGDCNPGSGQDFRFRGHLDFVDPNDIYHEVQEYDYVCGGLLGEQRYGGVGVPHALGFNNGLLADTIKDLFPYTYSDPHNFDGCQDYANPTNTYTAESDPQVNSPPSADPGNTNATNGTDPVNDPDNWTAPSADPGSYDPNTTVDPGYFDMGHKCNGSIQDLFLERLWITPIHDPIVDPTINAPYNFALQIDTCSGMNIYEGAPVAVTETPAGHYGVTGQPGKSANGTEGTLNESDDYNGAHQDPNGGVQAHAGTPIGDVHANYGAAHDIDAIDYFLDANDLGQPLVEVCTDGSSFSFDDTPRGRTLHDAPPNSNEDIMRGNSFDSDGNSTTFTKHRQNCRSNYINWPYNDYPGRNQAPAGPAGAFEELGLGATGPRYTIGDDCYPEDHKTAQIDIYVYDEDPTGQFMLYTNGMTGLNTYVEGPVSDPNYLPPVQPQP